MNRWESPTRIRSGCETRQDFVVAGQLEIGEQFRTVTGQSVTLTKIHPHRGPPEMVFNLEVDGQHVYHVANSGLLVHNVCPYSFEPQYILSAENGDLDIVNEIAAKMRETNSWGDIPPILAQTMSDGTRIIIDGHHRIEAAKIAGLTSVDWIEATAEQIRKNRAF